MASNCTFLGAIQGIRVPSINLVIIELRKGDETLTVDIPVYEETP
mgnify:CR=1 FL=1